MPKREEGFVEDGVLTAHQTVSDGVVEEVAGTGGVIAQVDAGSSDWVKLGATV